MVQDQNLDQEFRSSSCLSRVPWLGSRHYQCVMLFFMMALVYSMRFNLSVAIVTMTSPTGTNTDNEVLTGHLSRRYGAKYFHLVSMLVRSIITILNPLIAFNCSWIVFCISRIYWDFSGLGGSSMMILSLCFVERNVVAAMTFITLSVTFSTFMFSGFNINYLDLSPNFAEVVMGLCNGMENVGTIIAPLYVGWVVSDLESYHQWRWAFAAIVVVSLLGNAMYVTFGIADVQPWNSPTKAPKNTKNHGSNEKTNEAFTET